MHSLLEGYLNEVAERLGPLPVTRRNEEIKEMRQHLLNAVIVNREFGQSEAETVANAIQQFGVPQVLADSLVEAWRREKMLKKRSLWTSAFATPIILGGFLYLLCSCDLLSFLWPSFEVFCSHHPNKVGMIVHGSFFVVFALTGLIVGLAAPTQTVRGVCLGLVAYAVIRCGLSGWRFDIPTQLGQFMADAEDIVMYLAATLSAWAASRWRNREALQRNITATSCQ